MTDKELRIAMAEFKGSFCASICGETKHRGQFCGNNDCPIKQLNLVKMRTIKIRDLLKMKPLPESKRKIRQPIGNGSARFTP